MDLTQFNLPLFVVGFTGTILVYLLIDKRRKAIAARNPGGVEERAGPNDAAAPAAAPSPAGPQKATPGSAKPPELVDGFRDLRWGDPPSGLSLLKDDGEEALYMRAGDAMRLGSAQLVQINYQYWKGKLAGVVLQIAPGSLGKVMDELRAAYGRPSHPKGVDTKFYWLEGAETQAMLEADQEKQSGTAVIFSKSTAEHRRKK